MSKLKSEDKPFEISKWLVWDAYKKVKANKGAPGVDGQAIEQFEQDLENNLYRLWNRLSSGRRCQLGVDVAVCGCVGAPVEVGGSGGDGHGGAGDLMPGGESCGHFFSVLTGGEPVSAGPEMRGDPAEHREESLRSTR